MSQNSQKKYFLEGGGDLWFDRNQHILDKNVGNGIMLESIDRLPFRPEKVLEIGSSSGEKLKLIQDKYQCQCHGIEPSAKAVTIGNARADCDLQLLVGTGDELPYEDNSFDLVLMAGVLIWCPRNSLFSIAHEVDRVLKPGGAIILGDYESRIPLRNTMHHAQSEVWSYKMEYEKMFTWHPQYFLSEKRAYSEQSPCFHYTHNERLSFATIIKTAEEESMVTNPWAHDSK